MFYKTPKFFKNIFSYFSKTKLKIVKSSGLVFIKDFMIKSNLVDNLCKLVSDNRNPLLISYFSYEILGVIILRIIDGELRFYNQKSDINNEFYKSIIDANEVPHFTTLRYYLNRNPQTSYELDEVMEKQVLEEIKEKKLKRITIDIDQTARVLYGRNQGVKKGYVAGRKNEKCYQLFVCYVRELSMIYKIELIPGNEHCAKDFLFRLGLIVDPILKEEIELTVICDSGYDSEEVIEYLDKKEIQYIFARKQAAKVKKRGKDSKIKQEYKNPETAETELVIKERKWRKSREIFIQNKIICDEYGQYWIKGFDSNEFTNVLVTNIPVAKEVIYSIYKKRAIVENVIKELKDDFGFGIAHNKTMNFNRSLATLVAIAYNLKNSFVNFLTTNGGMTFKSFPTLATLRSSLIQIPGIFVNSRGRKTLKLTEKYMQKFKKIILIFNYNIC